MHNYRDRISINEYLTSTYLYLIHDFIHLSYRDCCIIVNVIFVTGTNWAKDHQLAPYNEIVYFAKHYSVLLVYSDLCVAHNHNTDVILCNDTKLIISYGDL